MKKSISRRALLRGAAGAGIALPFLSSWGGESGHGVLTSRARADETAPKRIVFWYGPWGTLPQYWTPRGGDAEGRGYELGEIMQPLAEFRDRTTVLSGVNLASVVHQLGRQGNHSIGSANVMSASGQRSAYPYGPDAEFIVPAGPSIDQAIASRLDARTTFESLVVGDSSEHNDRHLQREDGSEPGILTWPHQLFEQAFGDFAHDAAAREQLRLGRRSMLDAVLPGYEHLSSRVSADDRRALDAHLSSLRDLERRIAHATVCAAPPEPTRTRWDGSNVVYDDPQGPYVPLLDLAARALTCDLTRVLTVRFAGARAQVRSVVPTIDELRPSNVDGDAHSYSHAHWAEPGNTAVWKELQIWRMRLLADFLRTLDSAIDVDGRTVLDNTLVVHVSEILTGLHDTVPHQEWGYSNRMEHPPARPSGLPFFYVGDLGGALHTGRHVRLDGEHTYFDGLGKYSHGELYLTLARAMGIGRESLPSFGTPELCHRLVGEIIAGDLEA
ncbi:MAG: DUF1552 domain-containing protein [Myxococcota bacterium]|nr:DUF1552 domain-containing protein [Myxococcota bacterium]